VSLLIISIGLLGLAGVQTATLKHTLDQAGKSQLDWLMVALVEGIRANPEADRVLLQGTLFAASCPPAPGPNCSDNNLAAATENCSANSAALYHRWEVVCGHRESGVISSASDAVTLNSLTVSCSQRCRELSVTADWTPAAPVGVLLSKTVQKQLSSQKTTLTVRL
jgi:Tfp pilus assembly protein PilV